MTDDEVIVPDPENYNRGTLRGRIQVEESLRRNGAARGISITSDNVAMAGSTTLEVARELNIPIRIIDTDGEELIAIRRRDVVSGTPKAKEIGYADNRSAQVGLDWDNPKLRDDSLAGRVNLSPYARADEILDIVTNSVVPEPPESKTPGSTSNDSWGTISLRVPMELKRTFDSILLRQPGNSRQEKFQELMMELGDRYGE